MAKVLNSCGNSQHQSRSGKRDKDSEEDYILNQLNSLPPSKQLLQFYQSKLFEFEKQDKHLLQRIQNLTDILDTSSKLRLEVDSKDALVFDLQTKLNAAEAALRKQAKQAKVKETRSKQEKVGSRPSTATSPRRSTATSPRRSYSATRTPSSASSVEVDYLKDQIVEQELCHKHELDAEKVLRKQLEKQLKQDKLNYHLRLNEQEEKLKSVRKEIQDISNGLLKEREQFRKQENSWLQERTRLTRKLDYFEKFGDTRSKTGENAESRLQERVTGEKMLRKELLSLKQDNQEKDTQLKHLSEMIRELEGSNLDLQSRLENRTKSLEKANSRMSEENKVLKERINKTETRRNRDNEGYMSDIRTLRQKISSLESKILALTSSKHQEKENERILEEIRDSLDKNVKSAKKEWVS